MEVITIHVRRFANASFKRIIRTNKGDLRPVPNYVIALTFFMCASVLMQGIGDIALKLLSYTPALPTLPWRIDFLFLTSISVLMGYRTLTGMLRQKFDVTRNSIELGILVEISLVVGDSIFIHNHMLDIPHVIPMRLPFILLTMLNIAILLYTYHVLQCRNWFWKKPFFKRYAVRYNKGLA